MKAIENTVMENGKSIRIWQIHDIHNTASLSESKADISNQLQNPGPQ